MARGHVLSAVLISLLACSPLAAQSTSYTPKLTFDVASVREAAIGNSYTVRGDNNVHSSYMRLQNVDLLNLLTVAYGAQRYQLANLPQWPFPSLFTVEAKGDSAADEVLAKLSKEDAAKEKQHMLQVLLTERFHLKVHWEARPTQTYELVVSKPGLMKENTGAAPTEDEQKYFGKYPIPSLYQRNDGRGYDYIAHGATMPQLVATLQMQMSRPVTDNTGLQGKYDFVLPYRGRTYQDRNADDADPMLPMDESVQQVLGLKLKPAQGTMQVLVIDHVEKPSEN